MPSTNTIPAWNRAPSNPTATSQRLEHVRYCSPFAAGVLDRHPDWLDNLDEHHPPAPDILAAEIARHGLDAGLRRFRNRQMLSIIWRDLAGLAALDETFSDLTALAEVCLQAALDEHFQHLKEKYGTPCSAHGEKQQLVVIGMGKLGGGELNLSSDIDIMFCYGQGGQCDGAGKRALSNEQFFIRLARAVIASLADVSEDGFCFRVDTRLRPFGDSGPLCSSLAAMEQYYQREGRDWERYALIKARPVAGDLELGGTLMRQVRPFVYRRYIDFTAVEALQDMHAQVSEDARRKDRLDDVKRGPGGIREIEFLAQCFQLLRGGREPSLQTPSLRSALAAIEELGLLDSATTAAIRADYVYLRCLENRIQALRDHQTHSVPVGEDLLRLVLAMGCAEAASLQQQLDLVRRRVTERFQSIFPAPTAPSSDPHWAEVWRALQADRQTTWPGPEPQQVTPFLAFLRGLERLSLSQRAHRRLDQFMPVLLQRLDRLTLADQTLHRVYDLVLAICQRSPYLVLLVQNAPVLDRLIDLFARSEWIATSVIRFPALLDELIDPSLGQQIPGAVDLQQSVGRMMHAAQETEAVLSGLNYLKLATSLRIAVAQLDDKLDSNAAQAALASLAAALLQGLLDLAGLEIEARHGHIAPTDPGSHNAGNSLAVIAYGSLGAFEPGYESDLDLVFLFDGQEALSDGPRSLPAERYYARLAQRLLSFLTVMTPSGRLYPVDTRLRPNGRAGSLVSSLDAFADYQLKEAWTWELQALTRARFLAGNAATGAKFEAIRTTALQRPREPEPLRTELGNMRRRMMQEHVVLENANPAPKHQPGGLVDIEFVVQLGVLVTAWSHPEVTAGTTTLGLLRALVDAAWLKPEDAGVLEQTARALHRQRMLETLVPGEHPQHIDSSAAAAIFARLIGDPVEF